MQIVSMNSNHHWYVSKQLLLKPEIKYKYSIWLDIAFNKNVRKVL